MGKEAHVFARYLCGEIPPEHVLRRYEKIISGLDTGKEKALRSLILSMPFLLHIVDPALALFRPGSTVRRRLHIMFAVLECEPHYASRFMPHPLANRGLAALFFSGAWSLLKAIPGSLILIFL